MRTQAHRGLAQLMPATRRSMLGAMLIADPVLLRAYTWYRSQVPPRPDRSSIKRAFQQKGEIIECRAEGHYCDHAGRNNASETFDLSEKMRGATAGKAMWNTYFKSWQAVPNSIFRSLVADVRKRKGLNPEPPSPMSS